MNRRAFVRFSVILNGVMNTLTGLALLFAPGWFYSLASFPPFNRHFMGDIGMLQIALGLGLLAAARRPEAHRLLIGAAALGTGLHVLNHLYDDFWVDGGNLIHLASNTAPLAALAALLAAAFWLAGIDAPAREL